MILCLIDQEYIKKFQVEKNVFNNIIFLAQEKMLTTFSFVDDIFGQITFLYLL